MFAICPLGTGKWNKIEHRQFCTSHSTASAPSLGESLGRAETRAYLYELMILMKRHAQYLCQMQRFAPGGLRDLFPATEAVCD